MAEIKIKNKSEFVRGVLREIGALTKTPPDDWRDKVLAALAKQNLAMHHVMIYGIRRKAMQAAGLIPAKSAKSAKSSKVTKWKKPGQKFAATQLSLDDLVNVRKIAEDFGGVGKLSDALTALQKISALGVL